MGLHENAWQGLQIVILGKTPGLAMKIEQTFASAAPAQEVRLESFEHYDDAYDYCRQSGSCGLLLLDDNQGDLPLESVFSQLGRPYQNRGWPCFGVIYHAQGMKLEAKRAQIKNKYILDYIDSALLSSDAAIASSYLDQLWQMYVDAFSSNLIPDSLVETLKSVASATLTDDTEEFKSRVTTVLTASLNISWLDTLALRWEPVFTAVQNTCPSALTPHQAATQIVSSARPLESIDLKSVIQSKEPLVRRVSTLVNILDKARVNNSIDAILAEAGRLAVPGSPALIRQLSRSRDQIRNVVSDLSAKKIASTGG